MKTMTCALLVLFSHDLIAGGGEFGRIHSAQRQPQLQMTGNIRVDLFGQTQLSDTPSVAQSADVGMASRKSPYIAAGLSLVVPGAGHFYTERYWEAAAFFAADVVAWVLAYHYDKKGDRQTDFFQNYADEHWSVVDYATYAEATYAGGTTFNWRNANFNNTSLRPWQRVDWNELNRMERHIGGSQGPGQYYSHTLPPYGDQQYYELIGKYGQFNQGWDDAPPTYQYLYPVTARFSYYAGERGKANSYYNTASTWVTVAIINHVLNAAYAGLSAGWYNSAHAELGLQRVPTDNGYANVPVVKVRWEF
jgi:hypothetical protein